MLKIIYGTELTNKEDLAFDTIKKDAESGTAAWILVPEQFSLSTEKTVLKKFGVKCQKNIKVLTFSRLCNLIFGKLGPLRMQYIDGAGKQIVAARTMRLVKNNIKALSSSIKRRGFTTEIVNLISELKRYGVTSEKLDLAAETIESESLSLKLSDISLILENFNSLVDQNMSDSEDNLTLVIPKIKDCDFLRGNLYIMHFRSFTPVEYSVLGELMKIMNVVAVMCCDNIKKPSSIFSSVALTCLKLEETAQKNSVEISEPTLAETKTDKGELGFLCNSYFSNRPLIYREKPEKIHIFEVSNNYREAEAAADLILRLCRTQNRIFSDFLILARNTADYNRIMPSVFESRGIDIFLDTRRSIMTKPLTVMICSILDILSYGYSYERVMNIAKSGMLDLTDDDVDLFENYLLAVNPTHSMWEKNEWVYVTDKEYEIEKINETRKKITFAVDSISSKISGRKTAGDICAAFLSVIEDIKLEDRLKKICDKFDNKNMPYISDEYRQVWNSIISVFSQISSLMDDDYITWQDFSELFKNACSGLSVGLSPQTQGSVTFSEIDRFRSSNVPVIIVLGMTDGVFPMPHSSEGLISDAEREELLKSEIILAPGADAKRHEEQFLIYSVLNAANDELYLFYPQMGNDSKKIEPSSIINKIKKIFPEIKEFNPDKSGDPLGFSEGKAAAFDILVSQLSECDDKRKLGKSFEILFDYFKNDTEYKDRLFNITEKISAPPFEKLTKESVEKIYGEKLKLSASKLEKYNSCAYSFFLSYGLYLSEREKAGIESSSMGSIQHAALYEYLSDIKEKNIDYNSITREDCFNAVYEIVKNQAIKDTELLYESSSYYKYVVTRMQGIAARTAWEVVKFYKSSAFRPLGYEIKINTDGDIPSLEIEDEGKNIASLTGFIDRADSAVIDGKNYISIIDYKSSQKNLDEELARAGVRIQPLLYSDIICKRMNANPAAMIYMQMTNPIINSTELKNYEKAVNKKVQLCGWVNSNSEVLEKYSSGGENGEKFVPSSRDSFVSEEDLKKRIALSNDKIKQSAIEIFNGNIKAEPYKSYNFDACEYCLFGSVCNKKGE